LQVYVNRMQFWSSLGARQKFASLIAELLA